MARGRFTHSMDEKGRVSIPAVMRTELQEQDERPPILTNLVDCPAVGLFTLDPHEGIVETEMPGVGRQQEHGEADDEQDQDYRGRDHLGFGTHDEDSLQDLMDREA